MSWRTQFIIVLLELFGAILFALFPNWTGVAFTPADQVTVGMTLFCTLLLINVLILLRTVASARHKELEQWSIEEELDAHLTVIRKEYHALVRKRHGDDDLFVGHYVREITELANDIHKSSHLDELWVGDRHSETVGRVMSAFLEETKPVHRSVWIMEPNERLFEIQPDREYLSDFEKAAAKRSFGGVRTLCVVTSEEHLKDVRIAAFLDFYRTTPKFECKVVLASEYEKALTDDQLGPGFVDFGIYGTRMVFLTAMYEPVRKGVFVRRQADVTKYTKVFDRIWKSRDAKKNPSIAEDRLNLDELIAIDDREMCEITE